MRAKTIGALLGATAALTASGDSAPKPSAPSEPKPAAASHATVTIKDFKFGPARVAVNVGAKVTFTNADRAPHTATATPGFDTGVLAKGKSRTVTIAKAGTFDYVCQLHPYMKATIVAG
jgi:plastocyanin